MTSPQCPEGRPLRLRRRDGSGGGRGTGRGGRGSGGGGGGSRGTSAARGVAASAAAFVAKDVLDPDGIVRPLLRGAAERLQNAPSRLLCRAGARYLALDPHPHEVMEPSRAAEARRAPAAGVQAALPRMTTDAPDVVEAEAVDEPAVFDEVSEVDDAAGDDAIVGAGGVAPGAPMAGGGDEDGSERPA